MRVDSIKSTVTFGNRTNGMVIPSDIGKNIKTSSMSNNSIAFCGLGLKPVAVPICDTFVHVFK
ncbi:hypothetical protein IJ674_08890 [bacterium]|jgi:hypothetical protein|nr:hypothetical protein [bacterium]